MTGEPGQLPFLLALLVADLKPAMPLIGAHKRWLAWIWVAGPAAKVQAALLAISFRALSYAVVTLDYSERLVVENSHTLKPMPFKVTGVRGNREGSMILWCLIVAVFSALAALLAARIPCPTPKKPALPSFLTHETLRLALPNRFVHLCHEDG